MNDCELISTSRTPGNLPSQEFLCRSHPEHSNGSDRASLPLVVRPGASLDLIGAESTSRASLADYEPAQEQVRVLLEQLRVLQQPWLLASNYPLLAPRKSVILRQIAEKQHYAAAGVGRVRSLPALLRCGCH